MREGGREGRLEEGIKEVEWCAILNFINIVSDSTI